MTYRSCLLLLLAGLSACSEFDMHGHDPKDYYAAHPIKNRVESRTARYEAGFDRGGNRLSAAHVAGLRGALSGISPSAVDMVHVTLHPSQMRNEVRREHLSRLLRSMGLQRAQLTFEPSDALERDDVEFLVDYAAVVSPRCPDWRTSGITTYSNTSQAGYSCASVTNLGLMVADPRDLEKGSGSGMPDAARNSKVIREYRDNKDYSGQGAGGDSGGASSTNSSSPAP